jgi:PPM family protein phosphatase
MSLVDALEFASRSDPGMVRSNNEDSVCVNPVMGVAVLADGMGGYNAGEVASGMATALLGTELEKAFNEKAPSQKNGTTGFSWVHEVLQREIARANGSIYQSAQLQPQYAGMGTTLVVATFHDNLMTVAHIGDSRLYRLRGEEFQQVTRDHSFLQEQIDSGLISKEQARTAQGKNLVLRALGIDPQVEAEIHDYGVAVGDVYLLCSDGLSDMVEDAEIGETLQALSANLELCAMQLVQMANDNGGRDNVSVILVKVKQEFGVSRTWWSRVLALFGK